MAKEKHASEPIARDMLDGAEKGLPQTNATPLSMAELVRHNSFDLNALDRIVVRIEVHDTGVGIRSRDLVDNKLFSPYVQTEVCLFQFFIMNRNINSSKDRKVPRGKGNWTWTGSRAPDR